MVKGSNNFMEAVFNQTYALARVQTEVQQRFRHLDDLAHGWDHVNRVYKLALFIAEREKADRFIVALAALMHDLGHTVKRTHNEHHADASVRLAGEIMEMSQIPLDMQNSIKNAILTHSFSRGREPETIEARVVHDADKLDALGAIGIMRWAITGTQNRTPQTAPYDFDDPFAEQHPLDDRYYMLDHFFKKLFKLTNMMSTPTGRALAKQRTAFMRTYLYEFRREIELW
jgi:uncharacterized protein